MRSFNLPSQAVDGAADFVWLSAEGIRTMVASLFASSRQSWDAVASKRGGGQGPVSETLTIFNVPDHAQGTVNHQDTMNLF